MIIDASKLIIDASKLVIDTSKYPTQRAAISDTLTKSLTAPGTSVNFTVPSMTPRLVQIVIAQVRPNGWKLFTERDGDNGITVYRWS